MKLGLSRRRAVIRAEKIEDREKRIKRETFERGVKRTKMFVKRWKTRSGKSPTVALKSRRGKKRYIKSNDYFRIYEKYIVSEHKIPCDILQATKGREDSSIRDIIWGKFQDFLQAQGITNKKNKYSFAFTVHAIGEVETRNRTYAVDRFLQTDIRGMATVAQYEQDLYKNFYLPIYASMKGLRRKVFNISDLDVWIKEIIVYIWKRKAK
jgi:hypothetical protein